MKNEGSAIQRSQNIKKMPWDNASTRSQLSTEPIFTDETGDIVTSIDIKRVARQEQQQRERKEEKKAALNEQRLRLRTALFDAGLDEYKLQLALTYADQKPNPYLQKELSKYRKWFGYAKREDVEAWVNELLVVEKKLEQLELESIKIPRVSEGTISKRAIAAPVGRLAMERKAVNAVPGSSANTISSKSSTLAISQRSYQASSEHPFKAKDYRLKWDHVIQQMTPEEKAHASTRFAQAKQALEHKSFDPAHKAKLEALFGTEDVPTAFAIHGYMMDRAKETEDASLGQDIFKRAYQEALRLLETGVPSRDERMTARAKKRHEATKARQLPEQNEVIAGLATGPYKVPPLTKELRQERLHRLADRLVAQEQQAKQTEQEIEQTLRSIPITPNAQMIRDEEMDKSSQIYTEPGSHKTDWERIDDELVPTTLSQLSEQFEEAFERPEYEPEYENDMAIAKEPVKEDKEVEFIDGLRRKMQLVQKNDATPQSFVMPEGEEAPRVPVSAAAFTRSGLKGRETPRRLKHREIEDITHRLMEIIAPSHKSPTEWIRTELNAVQGREKRAEVLAYLIDTFDLNKSFKADIAQIRRGTHQQMVDRYEKAIERFIPIFEKSLANKKLVSKTGVDAFVEKVESFAISK